MKWLMILQLGLFLSVPLFAEIRTITLSNAVDLALRNNLSISQAEKEIEIAEAQYGQAMADFAMPSVSASASFTELDPMSVQNGIISLGIPVFNGKSVQIMNIGPITNVYPDNYHSGVSISKPLFAGFKLWNNLSIKQAMVDFAKTKLTDMKKEVVSSVSISFYNLFLIKENMKMTGDLNRSLKDHMDYAKNTYQAGNATEYDYIRAGVQYKINQPVLLQLSNAYTSQKLAFCQQIGIDNPAGVEFVGDLYDTTNINLPLTNLEQITDLALSNDINLKGIDINIEVMKLSQKIAEGGKLPTLAAFFNYDYDYTKTNSFAVIDRNWNNSWSTGLQLSIPIDSWIPVVSKTWNMSLEAEKTINKLEIQKKQIIDVIALQVQTLLLQIDQSRENMKSQEENVSQAQLGYRLADLRYKAGNSTEMEVIDAEVAVNQAEASYLGAIFDYFSSNLKLIRLIEK